MTLLHAKNKEEQRKLFIFFLSIMCYGCAITGFLRTLLLCWEMGKNSGNNELVTIIYNSISPTIMIWSSILIAIIVNNVRKGIVFERGNAQLITLAGAAALIGGLLQSLLYNFAGVEEVIPNNTNHMLTYLLGMFIIFIGQIFHIGIHIKEEQDLTI